MIKNNFYVAKLTKNQSIYQGYAWLQGRSTPASTSDKSCYATVYPILFSKTFGKLKVTTDLDDLKELRLFWVNSEGVVYETRYYAFSTTSFSIDIPSEAKGFALEAQFNVVPSSTYKTVSYYNYYEVKPHYKSLKKQYKKESNQMFFRETLDGKINLFGDGYEYIKECSINDKLIFDIYQNGNLYLSATFNKTDCKFDHFKKSVELKLTANDAYTDVLNKYENTYDLVKLAPANTWLTLTKRCIVQIYTRGEKVISSYAGGTYWETDVDAVDSETELRNKYHFAKGPSYREVSLSGFNYSINASYMCTAGSDTWNSICYWSNALGSYKSECCIKFALAFSAGSWIQASDIGGNAYNARLLSNESTDGVYSAVTQNAGIAKYDTYKIQIWTGHNGTGQKLYESNLWYANDCNFVLAQNSGFYPMTGINPGSPGKNPTPSTFNLGNYVIDYDVWARMLCDIDALSDGTATYDLPYDDFAVSRANYKRCIGLTGFDSSDSVIILKQSNDTSTEPTSFGMNDYGQYFKSPWVGYTEWSVYPLARSTWGNTSLWVIFKTSATSSLNSYEMWCKKAYKEYTLKDCYSIGDAIKALVKKIDSSIKHEPTAEYSKFLYDTSSYVGSSYYLRHCQLYITQKTNILKGEYDQAAQKAEITLKDILDMLRDCFRCYWYIDSENRLIIEHVTYFLNGYTYNSPVVGLDLTALNDKFNRKNMQYCQHEIEYDKSDLPSRYEFSWADDSTDAMSNLDVDINDEYISKDNTEDVTPNSFSTDIDYMLFLPSEFSDDGFALLAADTNHKVPIASGWTMKDNKQSVTNVVVTPQNWLLSWNNLINHYIYDMPGSMLEYTNLLNNSIYVQDIRKSMSHDVEIQGTDKDPDVTKVVTTSFGNGCIEAMTSNIDTRLVTLTLIYEPE